MSPLRRAHNRGKAPKLRLNWGSNSIYSHDKLIKFIHYSKNN